MPHKEGKDYVPIPKPPCALSVGSSDAERQRSGYWTWVDRTRSLNVSYTYRVRAINSDGSYSYMTGREWSRRAPVSCG